MVGRITSLSGIEAIKRAKETRLIRGVRSRFASGVKTAHVISASPSNMDEPVPPSDQEIAVGGRSRQPKTAFERAKAMLDMSKGILPVQFKITPSLQRQTRESFYNYKRNYERFEDILETLDWKNILAQTDPHEGLEQFLEQTTSPLDNYLNSEEKATLLDWVKTLQTMGIEKITYELRGLMMKFQYQQQLKKRAARRATEDAQRILEEEEAQQAQEDQESAQDLVLGKKKKRKKKKSRPNTNFLMQSASETPSPTPSKKRQRKTSRDM